MTRIHNIAQQIYIVCQCAPTIQIEELFHVSLDGPWIVRRSKDHRCELKSHQTSSVVFGKGVNRQGQWCSSSHDIVKRITVEGRDFV